LEYLIALVEMHERNGAAPGESHGAIALALEKKTGQTDGRTDTHVEQIDASPP